MEKFLNEDYSAILYPVENVLSAAKEAVGNVTKLPLEKNQAVEVEHEAIHEIVFLQGRERGTTSNVEPAILRERKRR